MTERSPESALFEAQYWIALTEDLKGIHEAIGSLAVLISEVAQTVIAAHLATLQDEKDRMAATDAFVRILASMNIASETILKILGLVRSAADLSAGRAHAFERETGLTTTEGEPND